MSKGFPLPEWPFVSPLRRFAKSGLCTGLFEILTLPLMIDLLYLGRARRLPEPESNGVSYLKLPLNVL